MRVYSPNRQTLPSSAESPAIDAKKSFRMGKDKVTPKFDIQFAAHDIATPFVRKAFEKSSLVTM